METMNSLFRPLLLVFISFISSVASEFNPDVRWTCAQSFVSIFVRTEKPFQGVLVPRGIESDECVTHGDGANVAALRLPLVDGRCGVSFDSSEDTFRLSLDVRAHPVLIVDHDKHINITCRARNEKRKSGEIIMEVLDGNLSTTVLHYGMSYKMRISATKNRNISVGSCSASGGGNVSVQLSDRRGCSLLPSLLSHFSREDSSLVADLPSMFRFPNTNSVTISCQINVCEGVCEEMDCGKEDSSVAVLLDQTTVSDVEDDSSHIAISLTILEKEEERPKIVTVADEPLSPSAAEAQCPRPVDIDLLYALCIILAACSALGFTINICFCCALWRKKSKGRCQKAVVKDNKTTDFWIMEQKPVVEPEIPPIDRRISTVSYASVKQKPRRAAIPVITEYGVSSRNSDSSSTYGGDIYRRPDHNARLSNSTFMSPSLTMETDLDSSISSNQTSSYH